MMAVISIQAEEALLQLKGMVVALFPAWIQPWIAHLLTIAVLLGVFATLFAVITLLERKGLGRIQNRLGPNRVGPFGLLQPMADGVKMLIKEDLVPARADKVVHFLAPIVLLAPLALAFAVIPYGRGLTPVDLNAGLLFFFAVGAAGEVAAFMAGWSSRNKYSLLGALRAISQMISFEIPLVLSTLAVVMMAGSLSLPRIVDAQQGYWGWVPRWHVFTPWGLAGFFLFLAAATAESNRAPFDLPEGESELIGGFMTEYSGFKYAVFFMGEYFGMFAVSGLAITLFLGGWHAPLPFLEWVPSFIWFFAKLLGLLFWFIWIRGTLPRLRADQLMNFAWKFLLPLALINVLAAALWHFTAGWQYPGAGIGRWILCGLVIGGTYVGLGYGMMRRKKIGPRTYHFTH